MVSKAGESYVIKSRERSITPVPMSGGDVVACHVSFSAANDGEKPFGVLPNRRHTSVTTFAIFYKTVIFSGSVVSEQLPDDGYLAAVNAVKQIR